MNINYDSYETVIGLEVHAQLLTQTKLFCGDSAAFGGDPNTHISPITLALPGTLPKINRKAVEYAIRMGLACHSGIQRTNYFARKNYFYPDLPKGYQTSQHTTPVCIGGRVHIRTAAGERDIQLNRIHLEEDAGKSLHDIRPDATALDFNRAGVPLIEIVTEPDLRSGDEAYAYLTELRKMLRYLEICDGNMEEGSMRCDANISVRLKGETKLGTKVEVKNLNSIRNVKRAIEFESRRLIDLLEAGEPIIQQTRSFDADKGATFALRTKEEANDYRYFTDPDLPPFLVTDEFLNSIKTSIPALPEQLVQKYTQELQLPEYDARILCDDRDSATWFERLIHFTTNYKAAANWLLGPVRSSLNEKSLDWKDLPFTPASLAALIRLVEEGKLSFSIAAERVYPALMDEPQRDPLEIATALNLIQSSDTSEINAWIEQALAGMPDKVKEYKKGKKGLIGLFVGEVKKLSRGKADPKLTNQLLLEKLEN
ncbi:MAG TPA: Asp-tRNA(Asn)/Glu-tRNA(Gln) amidotransferase subunit GatB [Puia sp.]|uniref:Asp-tRNA(Asn)/Glu-tRNA(Gln) amidotransferase subunit GatB n=1 Tax=Puia sp. TaxID=2045100 RepID=UPI002D188D8E|nr:Asp-tRNA(Asn)/Glu-tRNA(Gln) amidotransferase subunit GatB [Puia sp.]HVU98982.1 Asp-tRNA(Asn)/Glu-tRNA(Gln) amidotransferase subunit GatB [Puia sp.]